MNQQGLFPVPTVAPATRRPTPEGIIAFWNSTVTEPYTQARVTPKRMKLLRARIRDHPDWRTWTDGIEGIERSLFARGLTGWRCSLDAIATRQDLIVKAAEGRYAYHLGEAPTLEAKARRLIAGLGGCDHKPRCSNAATCLENVVWALFEEGAREPTYRPTSGHRGRFRDR